MGDVGAKVAGSFELHLVGYFPKATAVPAAWTHALHVQAICSVSHCIGKPPPKWMERWTHNQFGFFNTRADALAVVNSELVPSEVVPSDGDKVQLFAYRLLPLRFVKGDSERFGIGELSVEPLGPNPISLGFDVVSRSVSDFFECSPLSCNGMAAEVPVNRDCLIDHLSQALETATQFSRTEPEPGPYYVIEVLRDSRDSEKQT